MSKYVARKLGYIPCNLLTLQKYYGIFNLDIQSRNTENIKYFRKKGVISMLNEEICRLRNELNKCISEGQDYSKIYKISVELDKLIAEYYKING